MLLDARRLKRPGNGFGVFQLLEYAEIGDKECLIPLTQKTAFPHIMPVLEVHSFWRIDIQNIHRNGESHWTASLASKIHTGRTPALLRLDALQPGVCLICIRIFNFPLHLSV